MKFLICIVLLAFTVGFCSSCAVTGVRSITHVDKYVKLDTLKNKTVPVNVALYFEGQPPVTFAYDKIARITITGGVNDEQHNLLHDLREKAKEFFCDAVVYVEFQTKTRSYSTIDPFVKESPPAKDVPVLEVTGLAVQTRK